MSSLESPWTPRRIVARAREVLAEQGLRSLAWKVAGELFYRRLYANEQPLRRGLGEPAGAAVAELAADEVDALVRLTPELGAAAARERLAQGHRCFVVWRDGEIAHAAWVATGTAWIAYLRRRVDLAPDELYCYETVTAPWARGEGLSARVGAAIVARMGDLGFRRALGAVMPENLAGIAMNRRRGFRRSGTLHALWLGSWRWQFGSWGPPAPPTADALAAWSRAVGEVAGGHYLDAFLGRLKRQEHLRLTREWGRLAPTGRLLKTDLFEEAMGPDAFLGELAGEAGELHGIDLSPAVVERARARGGPAAGRLVSADVRALPYADGAFATIVSTSTLDHFPGPGDLAASLRELHRVLAPGGTLVVTLDNRQNVADPLLRLARRLGRTPYFMGRSYRIEELRRELRWAGFEVEASTAILHNPRLFAVGAVRFARWLGWAPFERAVERLLLAAQRLERTPLRWRTGSFVAARARRPRPARAEAP